VPITSNQILSQQLAEPTRPSLRSIHSLFDPQALVPRPRGGMPSTSFKWPGIEYAFSS